MRRRRNESRGVFSGMMPEAEDVLPLSLNDDAGGRKPAVLSLSGGSFNQRDR